MIYVAVLLNLYMYFKTPTVSSFSDYDAAERWALDLVLVSNQSCEVIHGNGLTRMVAPDGALVAFITEQIVIVKADES